MKGLSVKGKMTLWYGMFLLVIIAAVIFALIFATRYIADRTQKEDLRDAVDSNVSKIHTKAGSLDISNSFENYSDGVYLLVYEDGNFLISGVTPDGFPDNLSFKDKKVRKIKAGGNSYYVYDRLLKRKHYVDIWLRGVTSADVSVVFPAVGTMTKIVLIILPLLAVLALVGGFRMTRRALQPLGDIADTALEISSGKDLSKRLPEGSYSKGKDELQSLVSAFNGMLDRLETAFLAETQFSDSASHELRTPVSVIMAQCEEAKENAETPEEYEKALDVIFRQAKNMSSLLTQLLTLARADKGTGIVSKEEVDVSFLLSLVCEELQHKADEKNITIDTDIAPDVSCTGDQTLLTMLFMNLLSNAISYGKDGGRTEVSLSAGGPEDPWPAEGGNPESGYEGFWSSADESVPKPDRFLTAKIEDDGIGIPADRLSRIWERFYQVDPSRSKDAASEESNAGLGLSMVRWIVSEHQGIITCASTPEKGSLFTVYLPADTADENENGEIS